MENLPYISFYYYYYYYIFLIYIFLKLNKIIYYYYYYYYFSMKWAVICGILSDDLALRDECLLSVIKNNFAYRDSS